MSSYDSGSAGNATSHMSAELSVSTVPGSEVTILAQVIIAIGIIPIEIIIVGIVFGIHRLAHRRPPKSAPPRTSIEKPRQDLLPYLQQKAELEDEQRRKHELRGENLPYELNSQGEIFQMPDEMESLILPVQRRQVIHGIPRGNPMSWKSPLHNRHELMGHEHAQELEC